MAVVDGCTPAQYRGAGKRLVLVEWEHPSTSGRRERTRIMLGEGESAAHIVADAQKLSDRVIVHSITPLEADGPCDCDGIV